MTEASVKEQISAMLVTILPFFLGTLKYIPLEEPL